MHQLNSVRPLLEAPVPPNTPLPATAPTPQLLHGVGISGRTQYIGRAVVGVIGIDIDVGTDLYPGCVFVTQGARFKVLSDCYVNLSRAWFVSQPRPRLSTS